MPSPNETQAVNLLRRQRTDPLLPEAQKAAKALVNRIQGVALAMTAQSVMRVAIAQYPEAGVFAAIERMAQDMERAQANDVTLKAIFDAAEASEEQRLAPFDAACTTRLAQIQVALDEANRDHRSKLLGQDRLERIWKSYTDKGLMRDEILKLQIPEPIPGRDFVAERNQWSIELEKTIQPLTTERDAILCFKQTRNETALPATVLALVEGEKVQS